MSLAQFQTVVQNFIEKSVFHLVCSDSGGEIKDSLKCWLLTHFIAFFFCAQMTVLQRTRAQTMSQEVRLLPHHPPEAPNVYKKER